MDIETQITYRANDWIRGFCTSYAFIAPHGEVEKILEGNSELWALAGKMFRADILYRRALEQENEYTSRKYGTEYHLCKDALYAHANSLMQRAFSAPDISAFLD